MKYLPQEKPGSGHSGYQQQVKEANIKRIFDLVRSGKCKSRAEIVRHMNLSATSVSVLVEELANRKLIDETGPAQTTLPGRRPISLRLNKSKRFNPSRAVMIGVCFPGMYIEQDHLFHTEPALGYALTEESIRRFQQRVGLSVYLFNNTRSMAYAEKKYLDALDPDAPETRYMIFVKIQEDIRCAIISNGDVYPGPYNLSGEIGHFTIDYRGRPCYCGNTGCLERYVNLNAILEDARQAAQAAGIEPPESLEALARRYPAPTRSARKSSHVLLPVSASGAARLSPCR